MKPYYDKDGITLYVNGNLDVMREMPENSIDTIITDPPYALEFLGKGWDKVLPPIEVWKEALRVAKPGAILMAFGGTRTYHRLTCAIEDAGWEIRDCVMWVYGSGFPKSHDISKAIDKAAGVEREVIAKTTGRMPQAQAKGWGNEGVDNFRDAKKGTQPLDITAPATEAAQEWDGYGTALKPAWEPIVLAMKPLDGTFAQNALKWGVAGLWIDGGRIGNGQDRTAGGKGSESTTFLSPNKLKRYERPTGGRWPANLIHDGSEEVVEKFPQSKSTGGKGRASGLIDNESIYGKFSGENKGQNAGGLGDSGSAARFFYCAKASKSERNKGTENKHPTVKPVALMRYLCRLTRMPEGGTVLDPFMGSGTTGIATKLERRNFIGIDREQEYCEIAKNRIEALEPEEIDEQKGFDFDAALEGREA